MLIIGGIVTVAWVASALFTAPEEKAKMRARFEEIKREQRGKERAAAIGSLGTGSYSVLLSRMVRAMKVLRPKGR